MKLGKRTRRVILYPVVLASGCLTWFTGFPIPTWDLERLTSPVAVEVIRPDGLVLATGRPLTLSLVKRLPADDPLMLAAIGSGVEITNDGKVFGLLWVDRTCGLEPYWIRRRVNLAALAVMLASDNLDESQVPAEIVSQVEEEGQIYAEQFRPSRFDKGRVNIYDLVRMRRIENALEFSRKPMKIQ